MKKQFGILLFTAGALITSQAFASYGQNRITAKIESVNAVNVHEETGTQGALLSQVTAKVVGRFDASNGATFTGAFELQFTGVDAEGKNNVFAT